MFLTVFTPTYNRAHTLPQLYASLCRQRCKDFVWLIVDDGSTDDTAALVAMWQQEGRIEISYHRQQNGGKMRAHNQGVRLCQTPLFVCIDSDDYIIDDCVVSIQRYWPQIAGNGSLAGMIAYRKIRLTDASFQVLCRFPMSGYATMEALGRAGFFGDTTLVFKTEVISQFPFLEVEGEKFSTEAYAYNQIDRQYRYLLVDEAWTVCEYMPDGFTRQEKQLYARYPKGWAIYFNQKVKFATGYMNKEKISYAVLYMIFARRGGFTDIYRQSELKGWLYPLLWLLSYYYAWKWREKYPR